MGIYKGDQWGGGALHSEALSFAIDVAQTQVDVSADALHRLYGQRTSQVLSVGPGCGQAEPKPAEHKDTDRWFNTAVRH